MLKYFNLFIILLSIFLINCLGEHIPQWRRQTNQTTFREDYTYIESVEGFYKHHRTIQNWTEAIQVCAQEEASLFYPETKEEFDFLMMFWKQQDPNATWMFLGISDIETEGVFVPFDGNTSTPVYINWHPVQPDNYDNNEDCVHVSHVGWYNDITCAAQHDFICKKSLKSLEQERNTTTSTNTTTTIRTNTSTTERTTSYNIQLNNSATSLKTFVYWPNATVPFFIMPDHFDSEQKMVILESIRMFSFKTCIKFAPLMTAPNEEQHVMTFINPEGLRRCKIQTKGHSNYKPHVILLGYNCLNTRELDMFIMRALGLPFEHNRVIRDRFIDVWIQNIEPGYIQLFTKENILPIELNNIPYDYYSIMHFGERDYSKNGHRTIRFMNRMFSEARAGLTPADIKKIGPTAADLKKIALIYGPECRRRDRAEKFAKCQTYPGVNRRKREIIERSANMSILVNPNSVNDEMKTDEVPATTLSQTEGRRKQPIQSPYLNL